MAVAPHERPPFFLNALLSQQPAELRRYPELLTALFD